ncbi:hypothetical protein DM01DRAFT_1230207 [Hesseltinella vesiculosa]|uniref:Uncharacterized protein n=1 Tax=Hesseltinella vesiculosa TaxID=101127 RepID=A0A1X2GPL0_9FUNG|nr:hypothetical protein DM01DRAFT_1230207 [Hesseltinella vesiculosa]
MQDQSKRSLLPSSEKHGLPHLLQSESRLTCQPKHQPSHVSHFVENCPQPFVGTAASLTRSVLSSTVDEMVIVWGKHVVEYLQGFATIYLQADLQHRKWPVADVIHMRST